MRPTEDQHLQEDGVMNKNVGNEVRSWANEHGIDGIHEEDGEDGKPSSPVVPAILWILSAAFILSQ